jgi:uncharacterized membrane protein
MSFLSQQPSSVTEILSASVKLYADSFTKLIGYSFIIFVFNRVLSGFVTDAIPVVDTTLDPEEQMAAAMQMLPTSLSIIFIAILISCVFYSAMIYRIDNVVNQRDDDFVGVLLLALKKFPVILVAGILYTIAITIGTLLLVVPGIILMISLAFCGYFILLEDMGGYDALMASHRLVWGDWWRTNIVFFVPTLVIFIVFFMMAFFGGITDPSAESSDTLNIILELLSAVITPYFYVIGYLQYHDLKLRKKM